MVPILGHMAHRQPDSDIPHGRSTLDTLHVHPVFVTTYRRPVFSNEMLASRAQLMRGVWLNLRRAARVQRQDRPRAPTRALPTQRRPIGSGQPAQRRIVSPATPAIPNTHPKIPVGQTLLVTVLLRRLVRRRTTVDHQAIHRTTQPARLGRPAARADKQNRLPPSRKRPDFRRRNQVSARGRGCCFVSARGSGVSGLPVPVGGLFPPPIHPALVVVKSGAGQ